MKHFNISIIGAGLAGQIAAIALARAGRHVALVAPLSEEKDQRTTALMDHSIRFMDRLGLSSRIAPAAARLSTMQIIDGTGRLLRAPTVQFHSSEIGLDAFGWNIHNEALLGVLSEAVDQEYNITRLDTSAEMIDIGDDRISVKLANGKTLSADFLVGADGRQSMVRDAAGISTKSWSYPQTAIVLNFSHSQPHGNISTEFHTPTGPFTQVPLPGNRSSLVWVVTPQQAEELTALPMDALSLRVEERMQSMLGAVIVEDSVQAWPLSSMTVHRFAKGRVALIGEAAHGFPPIGAQGLNLSLRDIIALTELLRAVSDRPIAADAGSSFNRTRRADIYSRTFSVDLLNRLLLSDLLPVQMARAVSLHLLSGINTLRSVVIREGIEPGSGLKALPSLLFGSFKRLDDE